MTGTTPFPDIDWEFRGPWVVPAKVTAVVDGDTFHTVINRGWHDTYRPPKGIRVLAAGGVKFDAPDTKDDPYGKKAATARARLLLPVGLEVVIASYALDDFGRTLAAVRLPDGRDYATVMTAYGHVKGTSWAYPIPESL